MGNNNKQMIKILGNRIMVSKVEDMEDDSFGVVKVQDSFVNKGKIEQVGEFQILSADGKESQRLTDALQVDSIVLFAKYSPDTQEIEYEGKDYKIVSISDVLAIL